MAITAGQQAVAADFVPNSGLAADSGKGVKLNSGGELDNTFLAAINSAYDQSQTTQNSTVAVGEADATTKKNKLAQSFIPAVKRIKGIQLYKAANTGSFTGTVTIALQADSAGSPSGSNLASVTISNAAWLLIPTGSFEATFSSEYASLVIGGTYWIVVSTSTSDNSNHPNLGDNSAGGYASGSVKLNNTTDGWSAIATIDLYFKTVNGTVGASTKGDSTGRIPSIALPYSFVDYDATDASLFNSNTETTVYTLVLPAGFFTATSGLKLMGNFYAQWQQNNGPTGQVNIKLNGTTVATVQYSPSPGGGNTTITSYTGMWFAFILNTTISAQKSVMSYLTVSDGRDNSTVGNAVGRSGTNEQTSSVDTSGLVVLTVTYQSNGAVSGGGWGHNNVVVEKIG